MHVRYSALLLLLCCACAPTAAAGFVYPPNCTVPFRINLCPAGDVRFEIVLRDIGNFRVANCPVTLDLSACLGVAFCDDCCPGATFDRQARTAMVVSDVSGVATFSLKMGGLCPASTIRVTACGVVLGSSIVSSPDQDGNLQVDATDATMVHDLIGTHDMGADFDGDDTVTEADVSWLTDLHGGHSCTNVVPARTATWGSVKILYR